MRDDMLATESVLAVMAEARRLRAAHGARLIRRMARRIAAAFAHPAEAPGFGGRLKLH